MRILFLNGRFPQISQTFVLNQIDYALTTGHKADIFCAVLVPGVEHEILARHELYRRFIYGLPATPKHLLQIAGSMAKHPARAVRSTAKAIAGRVGPIEILAATQVDHAPDVIVANFGPNGIVGAALKRHFFPHAKLVTIFHGHDVSSYPRKHGWQRYQAIAPALDLALCVTQVWAERLRVHTGIPAKVHYLGIPLDSLPRRTPHNRLSFHILFVGRMVEKKGIQYLLDAIKGLTAKGYAVRARLLGDGPLLPHLVHTAASLGIAERVSFEGAARHQDVLHAMAEADCLVAPSVTAHDGDSEGIPVTIMEAMGCGLPVVSTLHAGIPEVIESGVSGLLAPERNADALAQHIELLMTVAGASSRLADAARTVIETRFDAAHQNAKLFAQIEEMLN